MEFKKFITPAEDGKLADQPAMGGASSFQISARPVVKRGNVESAKEEYLPLPRSYGTETLSLLARDPYTVFAFWDIDWNAAFRDLDSKERKVHLRLLNSEGAEQTTIEVEPMAGSCYITVAEADTAYSGEIGYHHPATSWNCLAKSELISTPPDVSATTGAVDFATVPFHLSFQRMVDLLQVSKQENETLTAMLADLRERVSSAETRAQLTQDQRELARVVETFRSTADPSAADPRLQRKFERILGFTSSSPGGGFAGSSPGV